MSEIDTRCNHVAHAGAGWTLCPNCGTTCTRNRETGAIETYDRGSRDAPKPTAHQGHPAAAAA